MKKAIRRPPKNERDEQIEVRSKYLALAFVAAFTQALAVMCIIKGNPVWGQLIHPVFQRGGGAVL